VYEHHSKALLPRRLFYKRIAMHFGVVAGVLLAVLGIGITGYMVFAHFTMIDAFLDAAMLLGGMGPVGTLPNDGAKLFAGCYALFAGLVFIGISGVLIAPFAHRILHTLHLQKRSSNS
jgi:hypothetical protein